MLRTGGLRLIACTSWRKAALRLRRRRSSPSISDRLDHFGDRGDDFFEFRDFGVKLFPAGGSEAVIPRAAVVFGLGPFRGDPTLDEHPLEGGIQRAFFDG